MTIPGIFTQRDPRWSGIELGFNDDQSFNIYHQGCAITGAANIIWWVTGDSSWNPERVNQWMKDNGGFTDGANVNAGGLIVWNALSQLLNSFGISYHGYTTNKADTNNFLQTEANYALAQLTGPGFPMHFSGMPYVGKIGDSWDGVLKPVETYRFIGAHLFSYIVPALSTDVPPVEQVPIQAPVVAPAPEPVPTQEQPQPDPDAPVAGNGQPSGDIPITVIPPLPEYEQTFVAHAQDVDLLNDTTAIDVAGQHDSKELRANRPVKTSGTFTYQNRSYFKGTSDVWYGIPVEDTLQGSVAPHTQHLSILARLIRLIGSFIHKKG